MQPNRRSGWVAGVVNATRYPTDHRGGGDATIGNSSLAGQKEVGLIGLVLTNPVTAGVVTVVDSAGATLFAFTLTAANYPGQMIDLYDAMLRNTTPGTANNNTAVPGIKLSNTANLAASLFYEV